MITNLPCNKILKDFSTKVETKKISDQRKIGESWARRHISKLVQLDQLVRHECQQYGEKNIPKGEIFRNGIHFFANEREAFEGLNTKRAYLTSGSSAGVLYDCISC